MVISLCRLLHGGQPLAASVPALEYIAPAAAPQSGRGAVRELCAGHGGSQCQVAGGAAGTDKGNGNATAAATASPSSAGNAQNGIGQWTGRQWKPYAVASWI